MAGYGSTFLRMTNSESFCGRFSNCLLAVLRIVIALLFMQHGGQKLLNYPPGPGTFPLNSLMGLAGVLELVGGAFIFLGLLTRPVAFILSGEMAVAYFKQHAGHGFWPVQNGGELAVIYCFVFLYLAAAGAGALSLVSLWGRRRNPGA
jgi:putative oxidoreductase